MLTIRTACLEDEQAVVALWRRCGLVVSYNDPVADFQFAVRSECSDVLIGVDASGDIKSSLMVGHDGHRGWIYYVGSDPEFARRWPGQGHNPCCRGLATAAQHREDAIVGS